MTAMKGQAKDKLMVIKLFSINYARDLINKPGLFGYCIIDSITLIIKKQLNYDYKVFSRFISSELRPNDNFLILKI